MAEYFKREPVGHKYNDYAEISFTDMQTSYTIGTNANAAKAGSWPAGLQAQNILFLADQSCWVRFEYEDAVRHYIPKDTYMRFHPRSSKIYVVRDTVSGTLRCWLFG